MVRRLNKFTDTPHYKEIGNLVILGVPNHFADLSKLPHILYRNKFEGYLESAKSLLLEGTKKSNERMCELLNFTNYEKSSQ